MPNFLGRLADAEGHLAARIIRADGSYRDVDLSTKKLDIHELAKKLLRPLSFWKRMYARLRYSKILPVGMTFLAFMHWMHTQDASGFNVALVTTAGVNYLAADFLSSSSARINAFNFHDSGVGTTAAAIGDTILQTQSGATTRATGTQSTPASGQYRSIGTIAYTNVFAITEWGLFSQAAQGGTLWDHRIFTVINVAVGDSIQFQYTLTVTAGGS